MRALLPAVLVLCLTAAPAAADMVAPAPKACPRHTVPDHSHLGPACLEEPPRSCPSGSTPVATRAGPFCLVDKVCESDTACGEGSHCLDVGLCVEEVPFPGHWGDHLRKVTRDACAPGASCAGGIACEVARYCVPDPPPLAQRSCACVRPGSGAASSGRGAVGFAVMMTIAAARRRRR